MIAGRILGLAARGAWLIVRVLVAVGVVRRAVTFVGVWPTAAGLAAGLVVWGLGRWQRLERHLDARERRPVGIDAYLAKYVAKSPSLGGRGVEGDEHVEFARALAVVSARYLARCEDQANDRPMSGEGWQ
jgi:hypothetical protein